MIKVLDHGFVSLLDIMGDDNAIVQAARVSYGQGVKTPEEDRNLIRYLMRMRHTSPFEMVEFKFHMKLPIFVARQIVRTRTANLNEISGRYTELPEECYLPDGQQIKKQAKNNKQGRSEERLPSNQECCVVEKMIQEQCDSFENYHTYLEMGLAKEIARINLPLSTYTEWYFKIDLHNLFNFLKQRLHEHAQYETRQYAEAIYQLIKPIVPVACEAFEDYILNAKTFSAKEMEILRRELIGNKDDVENGCLCRSDFSIEDFYGKDFLSKREFNEFFDKLGIQ